MLVDGLPACQPESWDFWMNMIRRTNKGLWFVVDIGFDGRVRRRQ